MELLRERQTTELTNAELEAQKHNAQIKERYQRLLSAEADQFAAETHAEQLTEDIRASVIAPEAPVYVSPVTSETPMVEQAPQVTEFVRERVTASVFTPEKFENMQAFGVENAVAQAAEVVAPTFVAPVFEQAPAIATEVEASYSLTPLAKAAMAIFATVVVGMTTLIGVNSGIIRQQKIQLRTGTDRKKSRNSAIYRRSTLGGNRSRLGGTARSDGWELKFEEHGH